MTMFAPLPKGRRSKAMSVSFLSSMCENKDLNPGTLQSRYGRKIVQNRA